MSVNDRLISWSSEVQLTSNGYYPVFEASLFIDGKIESYTSVIMSEDQVSCFVDRATQCFNRIKNPMHGVKINTCKAISKMTDPRRTIDVTFKESDLEALKLLKDEAGVSFSKAASRAMRLGIKQLNEMPFKDAAKLLYVKGDK